MSKIFWEAMHRCLRAHEVIITEAIHEVFISKRAQCYARAIKDECTVIESCNNFIDRTVLAIAQASEYDVQHAAYNGQRKTQIEISNYKDPGRPHPSSAWCYGLLSP